ncbi:hypothetical protein COO60DRAFT_1003019 [Scenedesmus sp. NREL 46B-D3]|nr:hypothetical protein COO60DRAFT_1003019 [Scenedesmus sp. NREL 46B-D3]
MAVSVCLRLLLVTLPGSSQVPLLIRGLALQAGLACCNAALQCPACPSTSTFCHLWGPVCAEVLQLTPELLGLRPGAGQGAGFSQHQQRPGHLALMPLLGQMQELRAKVVAAAADLASLAVQVDAAVLHAVLDSDGRSPSCRSRLIPGALDVVEVASTARRSSRAALPCGPRWQAAGIASCLARWLLWQLSWHP